MHNPFFEITKFIEQEAKVRHYISYQIGCIYNINIIKGDIDYGDVTNKIVNNYSATLFIAAPAYGIYLLLFVESCI